MYKRPKIYPHEFKIQAIKHYLENGRNGNLTAKELGIPETTFRGWKDKLMSEAKKELIPEKGKKIDYKKLLQEKEKHIKELEEENLILKKSIGIFTKDSLEK